jgi:hypothetical protein
MDEERVKQIVEQMVFSSGRRGMAIAGSGSQTSASKPRT